MSKTVRQFGNAFDILLQGAVSKADYGEGMTERDYLFELLSVMACAIGDWAKDMGEEDRRTLAERIYTERVTGQA